MILHAELTEKYFFQKTVCKTFAKIIDYQTEVVIRFIDNFDYLCGTIWILQAVVD